MPSRPGAGIQPGAPAAAGDVLERVDRVVQRLAHTPRAGAGHGQATPSRLNALVILRAYGPLRIGDLAGRARVAVATMSRIADKLVDCGWARRHVDESDHRVCLVEITGTGAALLDTVRRDRIAKLAAGLADLEPAERAAVLAALPALESLAERITPVPDVRG